MALTADVAVLPPSSEVLQIVKSYEDLFKDRFTERDEGYRTTIQRSARWTAVPVMRPWPPRKPHRGRRKRGPYEDYDGGRYSGGAQYDDHWGRRPPFRYGHREHHRRDFSPPPPHLGPPPLPPSGYPDFLPPQLAGYGEWPPQEDHPPYPPPPAHGYPSPPPSSFHHHPHHHPQYERGPPHFRERPRHDQERDWAGHGPEEQPSEHEEEQSRRYRPKKKGARARAVPADRVRKRKTL